MALIKKPMTPAFALAFVEQALQRFEAAAASTEPAGYWWSDQDTVDFITAISVLASERALDPVALRQRGAVFTPDLESVTTAQLVASTKAFLQAYRDAAPKPRWPWIVAGAAVAVSVGGIAYIATRSSKKHLTA